ncbi:glycosyl hydrolase family 30, partial [Pseudomonas stutzeri]|nr:glycosyl hydrolase family 30 [Stutzerimonas stutzeri]
ELAHFGYKFLRPALDKTFPDTKIYFWDGSLNVLDVIDKPLSELVTPDEAAAFDGFAFHTYDGPYTNLFKGSRLNPNWKLAMTERRCMIEETPEDASHIMFGLIGNWLVRQGLNKIDLWNIALDERGLPNQVVSTGRRGVVTIDHTTGKVQRNLEYYMLRNFNQDVVPGSIVIGSTNYTQDGYTGG